MTPEEARARFARARVAHLATVTPRGTPHLVPVCFAVDGDTIYTAVDDKPKTTTALARLRNIEAQPDVALLADHYDDADWSALWWARAEGTATVLASEPRGVDLLAERYAQYRQAPPSGPVIAVAVHRWSGWSAG